jgi:hypothetical protein
MGPEPLKERAERGSGDFLPPSPPARKATARQDQARKPRAGEGGHSCGLRPSSCPDVAPPFDALTFSPNCP